MKARLTLKCPLCTKESPCDEVFMEGASLKTECRRCGTTLDVPMRARAPQKFSLIEPGEGGCPKCGAKRAEGTVSCARCGLIYDKWQGRREPFADHPRLEKQWAELREVPLDTPEHFSFLEVCFREGLLDDAARAYIALGRDRDLDVSQKLRQLEILAQMNVVDVPKSRQGSRMKKNIILIATLILFLIISWFIWSVTPADLL